MADIPERLAPIKACSAVVRLAFDGTTLRLYVPGGMKSYVAVSGKLGADFSLKAQQSRGLGVIPAGEYWIDPAQLWTASWLEEALSTTPWARNYVGSWGITASLSTSCRERRPMAGAGSLFMAAGIRAVQDAST